MKNSMNMLPAQATSVTAQVTPSIAERVLRDGFTRYEQYLAKDGIPSPATRGIDLLRSYGSNLNPDIVLSFFTDNGNLTTQAGDCVCYDREIRGAAWDAYKRFIYSGGVEETAEAIRGDYTTNKKLQQVPFADKSAISFLPDPSYSLPMVQLRNWQSGLLDLTGLASDTYFDYNLMERMAVVGYQVDREPKQFQFGQVLYHLDSEMAPVIIDWNSLTEVHLLVFYSDQPASRVVISNETTGGLQIPVLDLRAKPEKKGIYAHKND